MRITRTMKPGTHGTQRFVKEWGKQLVAVRYRHDEARNKTLTTIEIIADERDKLPSHVQQFKALKAKNRQIVAVKIYYDESELRAKIKQKRGLWSQQLKLWLIRYDQASQLGLINRIVKGAAERCTDIDMNYLAWNLDVDT